MNDEKPEQTHSCHCESDGPCKTNDTCETTCRCEEDSPREAEKTSEAGWLDKYQRTLAEFDNFRKRTLKEKAASYDNGTQHAVEKLLPILDNFTRALSACEDKENAFFQGISLIARQLDGYLEDLGVEAIPTTGETFDPNIHFAVAHVEDETHGPGAIIEEMQKGYTHKGRVIRPSMVKTAN